MPERRYTDEEVQQILALAAEAEEPAQSQLPPEKGMTLAEIQRIAAEAGISPSAVSASATVLDQPGTHASVSRFPLNAAVASTVPLARPLDDMEWTRLVAQLRDTFQAEGNVREVLGRREWRNGALRVAVQTVGDGAVLEMRTRKQSAQALVRAGLSFLATSGIIATATTVAGGGEQIVGAAVALAVGGVAMLGAGTLPVPIWLSERKRQFSAISEFVRRLSGGAARSLPGAT